MTLSMGLSLAPFVPNVARGNPAGSSAVVYHALTVAELLDLVDDFKNSLADELGLAHSNVASGHLYPASLYIWCRPRAPGAYASTGPAPWSGNFPDFDLMDGLRDRGITPIVKLEPDADYFKKWAVWRDGGHDDWLDAFAAAANTWRGNAGSSGTNAQGDPKNSLILLSIAQEQNGFWFPYSVGHTVSDANNGVSAGLNSVPEFKAGWARIHDRIRVTNQATHVRLIYTPSSDPTGAPGANTLSSIGAQYPGDAYCQYVGFTVYNNQGGDAKSLGNIIQTPLDQLAAVTAKSAIITETAINNNSDQARADWISGTGTNFNNRGYAWIAANRARVRDIGFFNIDMTIPQLSASPDWTLDKYPTLIQLHAYAVAANTFTDRHDYVAPTPYHAAASISGSMGLGGNALGRLTNSKASVAGSMGLGGSLVSVKAELGIIDGEMGLGGSISGYLSGESSAVSGAMALSGNIFTGTVPVAPVQTIGVNPVI